MWRNVCYGRVPQEMGRSPAIPSQNQTDTIYVNSAFQGTTQHMRNSTLCITELYAATKTGAIKE